MKLRELPEWLTCRTPSHPREVVEMVQGGERHTHLTHTQTIQETLHKAQRLKNSTGCCSVFDVHLILARELNVELLLFHIQ